MIRITRLDHRFVHHIPDKLEPGLIYISMDYATAAHMCCCGCGHEVVTSLTPTDWNMTFDGESITMRPSIGNWNLRCRSHYLIVKNRIVEAKPWSQAQIDKERRRDKAAKSAFFGDDQSAAESKTPRTKQPPDASTGIWSMLFGRREE